MSSNNVKARVELGLNVVIATAILLIAVVAAKRAFFPAQVNRPSLQQQAQLVLGTRVAIPGTDLVQHKKTLIFFLKKDCIYCEFIAPTYRELISEARKRNINLIAILPNPVEDGRNYVRSLSLEIENVQTGSPSSYKLPGTPSVLFVDGEGVVKSVWFGAEPGREKEMRDKLMALF